MSRAMIRPSVFSLMEKQPMTMHAQGLNLTTIRRRPSLLPGSAAALTPNHTFHRYTSPPAAGITREVQSFLGTTTLGQLIFFLFWYETYHVGQPEFLRQLAGKDDKVI